MIDKIVHALKPEGVNDNLMWCKEDERIARTQCD